ncbi:UNVERIFIED_CONTAM: Linoleate 9S-lipoxygenase 5 [Sesamum angustifolium]|uniref:Lipoxygenase n=1 Tax=Sesamum angustifolium TaxID=2727405 RepID=A0AAW2NY71_9LAMI
MGDFPSLSFFRDVGEITGKRVWKTRDEPKIQREKIQGRVVLMKKNHSFIFHLCVALVSYTANEKRGKLGKEAYLENWVSKFTSLSAEAEATFDVSFTWDESLGVPGAFLVRNHHHSQFYLKTLTLEDVPGHGQVHFVCNSWVYPTHRYKYDRVFFTNKAYLPSDTPEPLRVYREEELINLRGSGSGMLKEWDRVYDYAYYNDLGSPEKGKDYVRPVLGGSKDYPYPRRGRTGRRPNKKDPNTESRLFLLSLNTYVPRDEKFNQVKFSDFIGGIKLPDGHTLHKIRACVPLELVRELIRSDGERFLKFPMPDVIKEDRTAWRTDEEFGREMLAGVNPVVIRCLQEFPPTSKLDPQAYGDQNSTITREDIEKNMNGLTVDEAIENHKLFILDHHDALMPYLRRINTTTTKTYASRTVLLLQDDGTLKPLAIELSLPHEDGDERGAVSEVFTPYDEGIGSSIWQLAKAYAAVNDSGYHQLISHWLNTHAVIEPFIIATNRQLSVLHPIYKLLKPHFRDTIHINALARQILINAGGVLERTVFPARYALEMSSAIYKTWNFTEQALPQDLIKRGIAVPDPTQPQGLRLLIKDYPFAVDGLEIWSEIEVWVKEYCSFYYPTDEKIQGDSELQSWWTELREVGHGDLKDEPWWPKMQTQAELIHACTIIIWIASALHAAVNFGQYPYAGYLPNRPTVSRRFMPKPGTPEYAELESNPDVAFLKTITAQFQTLLGVSLIEILSRHSTDEIYLGQQESPNWTADDHPREAFERFSAALVEIETRITDRNNDRGLRNRSGPIKMPYMLLYPNTSDKSKEGGLTGKGIPNSISI